VRISVTLLLGALCLSAADAVAQDCIPPRHFIALDVAAMSDAPGLVKVSVPRPQFTLANLVCLVRALKKERVSEQGVTILIFDARYAADEWVISELEVSPSSIRNDRLMRATYVLRPSKHQESLTLTPLGWHSGSNVDSRIDLTVDAPQPCRFAVDNRCLLVFDAFDLDRLPSMENAAGSVVLHGRIGAGGELGRLRVASISGKAAAVCRRLSTVAIANVKTWWFEPASRGTDIRITLHFGVGMAQAARDGPIVLDVSNFLTMTATAGK
jgi:hypothetical protein